MGEAREVSSPPYDVIDSDEAREMARGEPKSFLHVIKPEIDLDEDVDAYSEEVYAKAAENFRMFKEKGYLQKDEDDCLYLYSQTMGGHTQYGLVCCCRADQYVSKIKRHEYTLKPKEDDRTRHVSELNANTGPVFLTYRDNDEIEKLLAEVKSETPLYDVVSEDDTEHRVWRIESTDSIVNAFKAVPFSYVADGHHRAASAVRVGKEKAEANPNHTGDEEYNWFLCVLFPASQLKIMAYNRCVKDLNGMTSEEFLKRLEKDFEIQKSGNPVPRQKGLTSMYLGGQWYDLKLPRVDTDDPVKQLDAYILQNSLLNPLLGVEDPRKSDKMKFVGGIRGTDALEKAVDNQGYAVAFSMFPVDIHDLMAVADAEKVMPPKSTWFEPKLRSGLLVHSLD